MTNNNPLIDIHKSSSSTTLDKMLYENFKDQEMRTVQQAKEFLGNDYTTEEIKEIITSFEYLINNWTEEYERKIFNNKTLKEILHSV